MGIQHHYNDLRVEDWCTVPCFGSFRIPKADMEHAHVLERKTTIEIRSLSFTRQG